MSQRFISALAAEFEEFLVFKRAMGFPYVRPEFTLRSFDRFIHEHGGATPRAALDKLLLAWLSRIEGRKAVTVACDLGTIRQFCLFRRRRDPNAFVPGRSWAPQSTQSQFLPHILSSDEIRRLLAQTEKLRDPFRQLTIRTLVIILYCTGLRVGEPLRLCLGDVDLEAGTFFIRDSKGKSRLVPYGRDLQRTLRDYRAQRDMIADTAPDTALLVQADGRPVGVRAGAESLTRLLRSAGLKPPKGRIGPRPYDIRHTFAVHRLTQWHRNGVDVHSRLPLLSAYMGHNNILGTEVYLTATPELLALAGQRFEALFAKVRPK